MLVSKQLEVNAAGFVVLMVFDVSDPQLAPDLSTDRHTLHDWHHEMSLDLRLYQTRIEKLNTDPQLPAPLFNPPVPTPTLKSSYTVSFLSGLAKCYNFSRVYNVWARMPRIMYCLRCMSQKIVNRRRSVVFHPCMKIRQWRHQLRGNRTRTPVDYLQDNGEATVHVYSTTK